ncbi:hypothetical protein L7F22_060468 [Adiantum nelumboides]|nr:hypothetical protein [Adiantum nelumboides]
MAMTILVHRLLLFFSYPLAITIFIPNLFVFECSIVAQARPPLNPVLCDRHSCKISNAYGVWPDRLPCRAARVVYPTSIFDIVSAVAAEPKAKQKVKVISKFAHSSPKLPCPGGNQGLVISTRDYNQQLIVDEAVRMIVTVDSTVSFRQLLDGVAPFNLALGAAPLWEGVSIAGMISPRTHGSSFKGRGGTVHRQYEECRACATEAEGYAKVLDLSEADEGLNAAKVSLGVISKIYISIQLEL